MVNIQIQTRGGLAKGDYSIDASVYRGRGLARESTVPRYEATSGVEHDTSFGVDVFLLSSVNNMFLLHSFQGESFGTVRLELHLEHTHANTRVPYSLV